jgi:hypothetical protein
MAHFEEVLKQLEEQDGVQVIRRPGAIHVKFGPAVSRGALVAHVADIMSSEELPFNGNYSLGGDGETESLIIMAD